LVKQGIAKLKVEERKDSSPNLVEITYKLVMESLNTLVAYQSPLTNSFIFNPSFLILPDLFDSSTPVPFL